jgi:hypothetical protein
VLVGCLERDLSITLQHPRQQREKKPEQLIYQSPKHLSELERETNKTMTMKTTSLIRICRGRLLVLLMMCCWWSCLIATVQSATDSVVECPMDASGTRKTVTIPAHRINDDYCDCPMTGADEPNTSACAGSLDWPGVVPSKDKPKEAVYVFLKESKLSCI